MDMKKIILEEVDDFDWVRDVRPEFIPQPNTVYYFFPHLPLTSENVDIILSTIGEHDGRPTSRWITQYENTGVDLVCITSYKSGKIMGHQTTNWDVHRRWSMNDIRGLAGDHNNFVDAYNVFLSLDRPEE